MKFGRFGTSGRRFGVGDHPGMFLGVLAAIEGEEERG